MVATPPASSTLPAAVWGLLICWTLTGCGTRSYEQKMQASLQQHLKETPFRDMLDEPATLAEGRLSIRLPKMFGQENTSALDDQTPDPRHPDRPLDANRIQPGFLSLPGYAQTYEHFLAGNSYDDLPRPVYAYLALLPRDQKTTDQLTKELRAQLVQQFGELPSDQETDQAGEQAGGAAAPGRATAAGAAGATRWQEHTAPNLDGDMETWQKITATGSQNFQYYDQQGEVKKEIQFGRYLLYLRSTDDYHIMIAWRASLPVAQQVLLEKLADICVGTVRVAQEEGA